MEVVPLTCSTFPKILMSRLDTLREWIFSETDRRAVTDILVRVTSRGSAGGARHDDVLGDFGEHKIGLSPSGEEGKLGKLVRFG